MKFEIDPAARGIDSHGIDSHGAVSIGGERIIDGRTGAARGSTYWRRLLPYCGTAIILTLLFWRIPLGAVIRALGQVPFAAFFALFIPFSLFYFILDSVCLTWVVNRFNTPMRLGEIMPIRASMYLPNLVNTSLGQGGVAYYLHRKAGMPFCRALSSVLLIAFMDLYRMILFASVGVLLFHPMTPRQLWIVHALRIVCALAWVGLAAVIGFFALARRHEPVRRWIASFKLGEVLSTFMQATPGDYLTILAIKAPGFLGSALAQYWALGFYAIAIPFMKLILLLPVVFVTVALPLSVAHIGLGQAAWVILFSANAPAARLVAYSLAVHFTFLSCNALIGLAFLPRASRELTSPLPAGNV